MLGCPIVQLVVNGTKIYFDLDGGLGRLLQHSVQETFLYTSTLA